MIRRFDRRFLVPFCSGIVLLALGFGAGTASFAHARRRDRSTCRSPLRFERKHSILQRNLVRRLSAAGFDKYLKRKSLSVALVDLSHKNKLYYAGINDNMMLYAASLPKIAILLSVVQAVHDGDLKWTHEYDRRLLNMIVASDNRDASWGVDLVGLLAIERTLRDPRYCFYDNKNGGLWVGRGYRRGGATNRDPLFNISHGATARQAARFYTLLDAGKLVTPHWSFRMLGLMSPPRHHHKFVGGLSDREEVIFLARKSGTWRNFHADSALIQHQGRIYIAIGISETRQGEKLMRQLIRVLDDLILEGTHRRSTRRARVNR